MFSIFAVVSRTLEHLKLPANRGPPATYPFRISRVRIFQNFSLDCLKRTKIDFGSEPFGRDVSSLPNNNEQYWRNTEPRGYRFPTNNAPT